MEKPCDPLQSTWEEVAYEYIRHWPAEAKPICEFVPRSSYKEAYWTLIHTLMSDHLNYQAVQDLAFASAMLWFRKLGWNVWILPQGDTFSIKLQHTKRHSLHTWEMPDQGNDLAVLSAAIRFVHKSSLIHG